jgi:hypothetical protein
MKMVSINKRKAVKFMPNFDGKGLRGRDCRTGNGRGICRRSAEDKRGQAAVTTGSKLSNLFWLVREVLSIWGAVKALRGTSAGPSLSITEHDSFERENRRRLQKPADGKIQGDTLDMQTPPRLIEYRRPDGQ